MSIDTVRARAWCITINNYTDDIKTKFEEYISKAEYGICGLEVGASGTPHIQGYFRVKNAVTGKSLRNKFPTAHLEKAIAEDYVNREYCIKGQKYTEYGQVSQQGKRTDLDKVKDEIMSGKKVDDIVIENPSQYHLYGRTFHKIEDLRMRKVFRNFMTEGIWVFGETGTGKSEYAFNGFNPETHYVWKYENNNWQDGYAQQDTVIVDEFRGQIKYCDMLTMVDKHPNCFVSRRGREPLPFVSKKVIVTSSMPPELVYRNLNNKDSLGQLYRRFEVFEIKNGELKEHKFNAEEFKDNNIDDI